MVRCPICGGHAASAALRHHDSHCGSDFTLFECAECQVQHWRPLTHPSASYYESEAQGMYRAIHQGERAAKDARFERLLADFGGLRGTRVLDVGCSDGTLLSKFAANGNEVWGIDIDSTALNLATARGLTHVEHATVEEFTRSAEQRGLTFDLIMLLDVLEHLVDPVEVLSRLRRLLRRGGRIAGTVPNRQRFLANEMLSDFPPHHFYRFHCASLARCLQSSGLRSPHIEVFQFGYLGPAAIQAIRQRTRQAPAAHPGRRQPVSTDYLRLRRRVGSAVVEATRIPSAWVERAAGRGFKLYFVAEARDSSSS